MAALLAASPLGQEFFYGAFLSGEQLSRNIARPIFLSAALLAVTLVLIEWGIRSFVVRRRRRGTGASAAATEPKMEN